MKPDRQTVQFTGRVVSVTTDEVLLPNGQRELLEVVHHPGGAAAVAVDAAQRVCLLRQYRYVADGWLWELPAGKLEPGEPPLATARRELGEEAGVSADHWHSLGTVLSSPGVFSERLHLFLATGTAAARCAPGRCSDGRCEHRRHSVTDVAESAHGARLRCTRGIRSCNAVSTIIL